MECRPRRWRRCWRAGASSSRSCSGASAMRPWPRTWCRTRSSKGCAAVASCGRPSRCAWFFRILRRAIVDRARRELVVAATLDRAAAELQGDLAVARSVDDHDVCACLLALVDALPPTQAAVLRRVELEGQSVKAFAAEAGIGESNAGVRVFRARRALRELVRKACGACAEQGCLDCCCRKPGGGDGAAVR